MDGKLGQREVRDCQLGQPQLGELRPVQIRELEAQRAEQRWEVHIWQLPVGPLPFGQREVGQSKFGEVSKAHLAKIFDSASGNATVPALHGVASAAPLAHAWPSGHWLHSSALWRPVAPE